MADLLQITTPITPKDYQLPNSRHHQPESDSSGQIFDLGDQTKIVKTNDRTDEYAEQDLKDAPLNLPRNAGGPGGVSSTLDAVKELLSPAAFTALAARGETETLNKITEFAQEVILTPENLIRDLVTQQENSTIFSGKLWDALRDMLNAGSEDLRNAVTDFARAAADNSAKGEILDSLSANLKFLSRELAPNKAVAEELMKASEALQGPDAPRNFTAIKSTLVQLVNYTNSSLLLDNKNQNLLPLIIHNMSRYSDNPSALRESFNTLLNIFDNIDFGDKMLKQLLADTAPEEAPAGGQNNGSAPADVPAGQAADVNAGQTANATPADGNANQTVNAADENAAQTNNTPADGKTVPTDMTDNIPQSGNASDRTSGSQKMQQGIGYQPHAAAEGTAASAKSNRPAGAQQVVRNRLEQLFDKFILDSKLPQDVKKASVINNSILSEQERMENTTNMLALGIKKMAERLDPQRLRETLSGIDLNNGSQSIKLTLASVTPNTAAMADALDAIIGKFDETHDLQQLIDNLSVILNSVDDTDKKIMLAQSLNTTLEQLANDSGVNYKPPTSLENLADFLVKNIDDKSLQSMVSANRSDIVQNMLTSPGVFNPLIHLFAPMDAFGMRAFSEIWVDRNADKLMSDKTEANNSDSETSHIFMCLDMENVGYFELEMFAKDTNLSVMLLCPAGMENDFAPLKKAVPRIAAASGYTVGTTIVDTLYQKRKLNTVFPTLNERRGNLNAKA